MGEKRSTVIWVLLLVANVVSWSVLCWQVNLQVERDAVAKYQAAVATEQAESQIVEYGQGVYYFRLTPKDFGKGLATFLARHPDLEVAVIVSNDAGQEFASTKGYFVTFRPKHRP